MWRGLADSLFRGPGGFVARRGPNARVTRFQAPYVISRPTTVSMADGSRRRPVISFMRTFVGSQDGNPRFVPGRISFRPTAFAAGRLAHEGMESSLLSEGE